MKITLEQAIQEEINSFTQNTCEFSAYTITTNLRFKVNNGIFEIDGLQFKLVDGKNVQDVAHDEVRKIVRDICGIDNVPGYDRRWNSTANGGYFSWYPISPVTQTVTAPVSSINPVAPTGSIQNVAQVAPQQDGRKYPAADPQDPKIVDMVVNYVVNCHSAGDLPTLKRIQSRMKRNRLNVRQIASIVSSRGYPIVQRTPYYHSTVCI